MGSLSGISFSGLSSGIDTDSIISQLMQIEAVPIQRLQSQQQEIQGKQAVYAQLRSKLQAISTAAGSLNSPSAFNPVSATSSDTAVATITANGDAVAGTYNLTVSKLAQAQKVSSAAQTDTTSALGKTGQFTINGKAIQVEASDSLRTIAQKVNSAGVGVTASLIDGGSGSAYLTFSSNATGASKKVQLADVSGDSIVGSLGFVNGAAGIRESITNGATSSTFSKNLDPLGTVLGLTGAGPATFSINGTNVDIDLSTDNLQAVADKINAANTGATAMVRTVTEDGATKYKLDITGASTPTFSDVSGNALAAIGITQKAYSNQLVNAQDAEYKLDGISLTSSSNTITTAIPNATLTLLKADTTTPATSTLTLSRDTSAVKAKITAYKDAYNDAVDFIRSASQFDKDSFASGPLFGDPVAGQVEQDMTSMIFSNVSGLSGTYTNLASLGFSLDDDGKLEVDDATLSNAISSAPNEISNLFRTTGVGSNNDISYVSSGAKSVASGAGSYGINITALATKGSYTAITAQNTASTASETLTFNGSMFGTTPYSLVLNVGNTLQDTVNRINSDSKLKDLVSASIDGSGRLLLESKRYGASGNFTVTSNLASGSDNSGVGTSSGGVTVTGTDIQGTINGEPATGNGQFLTGNSGNEKTDGLQIQYTGTQTGAVGTIQVRKGVGTLTTDLMGTFLDSVSGILTSTDNSLKSELDDIANQISTLSDLLAVKQDDLKAKFAKMEEAISNLQSQGQRMSSMMSSAAG